jgi:hypothetical protein
LLRRGCRRRCAVNPRRRKGERQRNDQKHDRCEDHERVPPAIAADQRYREWREQELSERSGRRAGAEGERPPLRRHQLAERADHDGERAAGQPEADDLAGTEVEHRRRSGIGHRGEAQRVEDRAHAEH